MPQPRNYQTEAITIKKTRLGEADSIFTFYTPHLGKIQGFAKSVRKSKSKMAGHLELLTHSMVSFARGRNIDTITGSQTINSFLPIKNDLELTSYALYCIELVNQFTPDHVENHPLFQLLLATLENLQQYDNKELILLYFELYLLHLVGYRPQLQHCISCHHALKPTTNSFSPGAGGMLCPDCSHDKYFTYPLSLNALKVLRFLQGGDFTTASKLKLDTALSREIETIIRVYIKFLVERDIKSASWLDTLREQMKGG